MSDLEDVKRKLYTPGGIPEPKPTFLGKPASRADEVRRVWADIAQTKEEPPRMKKARRFRFGLLALALFILGMAAVAGVFLIGFQRDNLSLQVLAKDRVESGERVVYQIFYKNTGSETLKDLELAFTYPAGSVPLREEKRQSGIYRTRLSLSDLAPGVEAKVELEARLFGRENEVEKAEAAFLYRLESSSSRFSIKAFAETTIVRVPLVVVVSVPDEVISRQQIAVAIDYSSNAQAPFADMFFGIQYPAGFEFTGADPAPAAGNNIWSLGTIGPGDSGRITIRGIVSGPPGESKIFSSQLGLYNQETREWTPYQTGSKSAKISVPLLSIEQRINEARDLTVKPGDELRFRLHYKNILDTALKNVSVEVRLQSQALDLKSLRISEGVFDGERNVIVWNAASFSKFAALPAGSEGDLNFSVRLKPASSFDALNTKNLTIESTARIASSDKPVGLAGAELAAEDTISAKISTRLVLSSRLLYQSQYLPSGGPLPPKVGAKTKYVVVWQLTNTLNDVANVEIRAALLPGVSWEKLYSPSSQSVLFDESSGTVTWRVGNIMAGAGISRASPMLAFQIGFTPGINLVGQSPALVRNIEVSAIDTFTNEPLLIRGEELTTELRSDPLTSEKDWKIVE
ncbi:MAG: hypothetical protein HYT40_03105 [Candidatus Sungbacteria bacterium]|uniref:DUF11 domain-containing protein n=1 Tax=Candidatus Sungiibacteriota bacterium TaxID=2750080 RepID=A0A931WP92_9BACT|nr:hypothetical protein [Candidatus Sungbacteria bacterium]